MRFWLSLLPLSSLFPTCYLSEDIAIESKWILPYGHALATMGGQLFEGLGQSHFPGKAQGLAV